MSHLEDFLALQRHAHIGAEVQLEILFRAFRAVPVNGSSSDLVAMEFIVVFR